jgi:succinate dehydrogenase membrane anchor subunit
MSRPATGLSNAPSVEPRAAVPPPPTTPPDGNAPVTEPDRISISPVTRGRAKPSGSRKELLVWYLMRITGVGLFVLALAHFSILHFIYDPAQQTAEFIAAQRWNQLFWRAIDWSLLMLVLFHSFLGVRTIVQDYLHRPRARRAVLWALYLVAAVLFVMGTVVILTLPSPSGAPS